VLGGAAICGTILMFLYPFDAADLFDNIMHGRMLAVYGANPFEQVAAEFKSDPFYRYVGWRRFPSAYGPGWELMAAATARLSGDGVIANVLAFKALGGLFLAGCVTIVTLILRREAPDRALAGVLLLAWNPLVLYETLGQGHNDVAMLFFVLASVAFLAWRRYTLSVLALVAGALIKFVPILLLPAAGLISLQSLPTRRSRLRFIVTTAFATVLLVLLAYLPFWRDADTLGVERRSMLFTTSLPALLRAGLEQPLGEELASKVVVASAVTLTALFSLWQAARAARRPSWSSFASAAFSVLLFYLLFTCLWFQQWYVVWVLGLVPLLPGGYIAWSAVFFGFAVLSKPLLFEPLWLWTNPYPDRQWLELRLGPAVLALPWLVTLVAAWLSWRARRSQTGD
jgi:hypothetical protein